MDKHIVNKRISKQDHNYFSNFDKFKIKGNKSGFLTYQQSIEIEKNKLISRGFLENDIKIDYYFNDYYGDSDAWDFSMREGSFSIATAIEYFVDAKDSSKIFFKYDLYDFGRTGHGISNYPNKYESSLTKNELQNENELRRSFLSHLDKISNPNYKISDNSFWIKLIKFIFN